MPLITYKEMYTIMSKMKLSDASGMDDVTTKFIKQVPQLTALYMTHLINCMIRRGKYPKVFKIIKVLPILKQGKCRLDLASHRPICNLSSLDKIIQEWMKLNLINYFEDNQLINNNHHGGRSSHSTQTAKAILDYYISKGLECGEVTLMINTDMSTAFNTVDHCILLRKIQ